MYCDPREPKILRMPLIYSLSKMEQGLGPLLEFKNMYKWVWKEICVINQTDLVLYFHRLE